MNQIQTNETEQRIVDYVAEKTKGMVRLRRQHANDIIELVLARRASPLGRAVAKKYVYNAMTASYVLYRTIQTTDELINERIIQALETGPVEHFYKYELYNAKGELQGNIYTVDASLFD